MCEALGMLFRLLPILLLAAGAHAETPVAPRLATVDLTAVFEAHPRTAAARRRMEQECPAT